MDWYGGYIYWVYLYVKKKYIYINTPGLGVINVGVGGVSVFLDHLDFLFLLLPVTFWLTQVNAMQVQVCCECNRSHKMFYYSRDLQTNFMEITPKITSVFVYLFSNGFCDRQMRKYGVFRNALSPPLYRISLPSILSIWTNDWGRWVSVEFR